MYLLEKVLDSSALLGMLALFFSVIWMLRDERDKSRPMLVIGLVLNLFFASLLQYFLGAEGSLLPWKYDLVLFKMDESLGLSAASIALPLQTTWNIPLVVVYQLMIPMMICWFLVTQSRVERGSVVLAYVAELVAGPLLYAVLPACGPIWAFGDQWLHPPAVQPTMIRLAEMPNAFPSLHIATALVLVLFAPGKLWRGVSLAFLVGTFLATLSTGAHYVIDLVPGLIFGCFAASVGFRRVRSAQFYLGVVLCWSLSVRFGYMFLITHPGLLRTIAALTVALAVIAVGMEWRISAEGQATPGSAPLE